MVDYTEKKMKQLIINKLTSEKYNAMAKAGTLNPDEVYITTDNNFYTKAEADDLLNAEIKRAQAAEQANASNISAEIKRAQAAESALDSKILAETKRAEGAESANASAIAAETKRAEGAEEAISTSVNAEIKRATAAEQANAKALEIEIKRATAAEQANAKAIETIEKSLGKDIEARVSAVEDELALEAKRALKAESALDEAKADKATTLEGYGIEDAYTKDEIDGMVSSVYHYKGTVATYAQLPTEGNVVGDVWNIETADAEHNIKAGDNVAWTGSDWDVLAGTIDLSSYYTKDQVDAAILVETKRATAAEEANATAIEALEKSLGKDIEARVSAVETELSAETKRAIKSETQIIADLEAEVKRAQAAEAELTSVMFRFW